MSVIDTTCAGAADARLHEKRFHMVYMVIIDEAAQATLTDVIIPASKLHENHCTLIFAGDHYQLPPISTSQHYAKAIHTTTALENLLKAGTFHTQLVQIHRMHFKILKYLNDQFYGSILKSAISDSDHEMVISCFPFPQPKEPLVFINIQGQASITATKSFCNEKEAKAAVSITCWKKVSFPLQYKY